MFQTPVIRHNHHRRCPTQLNINEIREATNGYEALGQYQSMQPNCALILLDLNMPALDGFQCASLIRSLEAKTNSQPVPIIGIYNEM